MMKTQLLSLVTGLGLCTNIAFADDLHFDMSNEAEQARATPSINLVPEAGQIIMAPDTFRIFAARHILASEKVRLQGEYASQSYQIYLTTEQAQSEAVLNLSYLNALVVAPESSRLRVSINKTTVLSEPISASDTASTIQLQIPSGVLRSGANEVRIWANQRHRTDCDINATYALWTDILSHDTFIGFSGSKTTALQDLDQIAATGVDSKGLTTVNLVLPQRTERGVPNEIVRLTQALALALQSPNVQITLSDAPALAGPGVLNVVMATVEALPDYAKTIASRALNEPIAEFSAEPEAKNALIVSGPNWRAVGSAIDMIDQIGTVPNADAQTLPERMDRAIPIPVMNGGDEIHFDEVGLQTVNFDGRRLSRSFKIALPPSFYAKDYGFATMDLKAAFSGEVLSGSRVNVFVNDKIASVTPVLHNSEDLGDLHARIPLTNFHAGVNTIEVATELRTRADEICAPGTVTVGTNGRVLQSGESRLSMPTFAKLPHYPNLSAFISSAYPYGSAGNPWLVSGPSDQEISAALTVVARLASSIGSEIAFKGLSLGAPSPTEDAVFVGGYGHLPVGSFERVGALEPYTDQSSDALGQSVDISTILQRWRSAGTGDNAHFLERARHWVAELLDLGPNSLGILPPEDAPFSSRQTDLGVALQRAQPEGGVWTMFMVPVAEALTTGIDHLTRPENLAQLQGRVSSLSEDGATMHSVASYQLIFEEPETFSLANLRLVLANWLSGHVLAYALGISIILIVLTAGTGLLLGQLGRRKV